MRSVARYLRSTRLSDALVGGCARLNHSRWLVPLLLISILSMVSCGEDSPTGPSLASITISPSSVTLQALGDTTRFEATAQDGNGNTIPDVTFTWSSSSPTVATINPAGLATAQGSGEASIMAAASGMVDTALVIVDQQVAAVTVNPDTTWLTALGDTARFEAEARDGNGNVISGVTFTWSSSSSDVVTVNSEGMATAQGLGEASIIASAGIKADTALLVVDWQVVAVTVSPDTASLIGMGNTTSFQAYPVNRNGNLIPGVSLTWTSSDASVATVDNTGLATAVGSGTASIVVEATQEVADTARLSVTTWRIAFQSRRDNGDFEIYVMNADGSEQTRLTNHVGTDWGQRWSPDGMKIAFWNWRGNGMWGISVVNADGSGLTDLSNLTDDTFLEWSPDGTKIAFTSTRDGSHQVYVMNADGSGQTNLSNSPFRDTKPTWSPDGTKIAFYCYMGNTEICMMNADGSARVRLTNTPYHEAGDEGPLWSPDGAKILFTRVADSLGGSDIIVMSADGSELNLTNNPGDDWLPDWSPDGKKIAFSSRRDGALEVYVMNADGSGQTNLTNNSAIDAEPDWSPDGTKITFYSNRDGNFEIYVMNADGSEQMRLTWNVADDDEPRWSPR